LLAQQALLDDRAENQAADPTESINTNFNSHGFVSFVFDYSLSLSTTPRGKSEGAGHPAETVSPKEILSSPHESMRQSLCDNERKEKTKADTPAWQELNAPKHRAKGAGQIFS